MRVRIKQTPSHYHSENYQQWQVQVRRWWYPTWVTAYIASNEELALIIARRIKNPMIVEIFK
jgi:hypothetical protein